MKPKMGIICGSFDLIHPGYIRMFKDAKNICEKLTIALQGDPTIDRPHKCKPIQSLEDRREVLEALVYVDQVVTYNTEKDLLELLARTPHDIRILGSDYQGNNNYTGANLKKPVHYHLRDHNFSTTALKEAIFKEREDFRSLENETALR